MPRRSKPASPFRYFNSTPKVIRLVVVMYVRFLLSLRWRCAIFDRHGDRFALLGHEARHRVDKEQWHVQLVRLPK